MAWNVIDEYKAWLVDFTSEHIDKHGHSGAELVHEYFPYYQSNIDYWIEQPVKMIDAIDTCSKRAKIGMDSVYYITAEDVTHGEKMQRL